MSKKKAKQKKDVVKVVAFEDSNKKVRLTDDGIDFEFENTPENIDRAFQLISGVLDRQASNAIIATAASIIIAAARCIIPGIVQ